MVEDDPNDIFLLKHAFEKIEIDVKIKTASKGKEALSYLEKFADEIEKDETSLSLIILDLKLPGESGFDVLRWIKDHDDLNHIPVIIMSSSSHEKDIVKSYILGANSYLVKPVNHDKLIEMVRSIKDYWFDLNETVDIRGDT